MTNIQKAFVRAPTLRLVKVRNTRRRWKLRNDEPTAIDAYSSQSIIRMIEPRRIKWVGHVVCMGQNRYAYEISVGRPERKRPLERTMRRWKNTKTDLKESGWDSTDCNRKFRQGKERWAFANPHTERISSIAEKILTYEGPCSKELVS